MMCSRCSAGAPPSRDIGDGRRHAKELASQHAVAEKAEASRLAELRAFLVEDSERRNEALMRVRSELQLDIRENANSLAAALAEMDDRMARRSEHRGPMPIQMPH